MPQAIPVEVMPAPDAPVDAQCTFVERLHELIREQEPSLPEERARLLTSRLARVMTIAQHSLLRGQNENRAADVTYSFEDAGRVAIRHETRTMIVARAVRPGIGESVLLVRDWWCHWDQSNYPSTDVDGAVLAEPWLRSLAGNYAIMQEEKKSIREMFSKERGGDGRYEGKPCYIAGSGPSLAKNGHHLSRVTNGIVIAVNGAVATLPKYDYFYTLDWLGAPWWYEAHKEKIAAHDMIVAWSAAPRVAQLPARNRFWHGYGTNALWDHWVRLACPWIGELDRGMTSSFSAFHMAVMFGANPIVFAGQDFALTDGEWHANHPGEKPITSMEFVEAPDMWGGPTLTTGELTLQVHHMLGAAAFAKVHGTRVVNASENGVFYSEGGHIDLGRLGDVVDALNAAEELPTHLPAPRKGTGIPDAELPDTSEGYKELLTDVMASKA